MRRPLRFVLLLLALTLALPASFVTPVRAATTPITTDITVPKALVEWLKKNGPMLYVIFDEIMDDLFGCGCPPPPPPPAPDEDPLPYLP